MTRNRLIILSLAALLWSCSNDMAVVNRYIDIEIEPDMVGENLEILQSDSARLQMRMITPIMKQFNSSSEPRDEYPEGLLVRFYEASGDLNGEVTANWARYDKKEELWEARDNVVLTRADGSVLETEQLFWDTRRAIIYSEQFTRITEFDGSVATGDSFTANDDFTNIRLSRGRASIIMREEEVENESEDED